MSVFVWIAAAVIFIGVPWFYGAVMILVALINRAHAWHQSRRRRSDNARSGTIRLPVPDVTRRERRRP